ncbi:hypothetical protein CC80DRAFT_530983 [Byssothecium circinans]|uniref:DUF7580 domain-containing protein n=1 Tax=Byssothecium circinans TaxID=147558 RepID=A0A6A5UD70_9PLEO|nr:hypothetical protein CC80DRAFT_530983 [Byssothecium circinans]
MVTGIETAGLVLGSMPLLILAIEKWHKGFVKALLKAADPDLDLDSLPQDYRDQLWNGSTADSLDEYLRRMGGEDAVEGFRGEVEASKIIVEEIGQHFRQGKEKAQPAKGGLKEIYDILTRRSKKLSFGERFGFTLHEKDIDRLTKELGHVSSSIASFVASATNLDKLAGQSAGEKSAEGMRKIVNRLYKTRDHALSLFNTLKGGWLADCQHHMHNALLHLQSDCNATGPLFQSDQEFHMLFQILGKEDTNALWRELAVVMNTDSLGTLTGPTKYGKQCEPSVLPLTDYHRTPLVRIEEDPKDLGNEVMDICPQISLAQTKDGMICFHVSNDDRLYWVRNNTPLINRKTQKRKKILPNCPTLVPLQTYLTTDCSKLLDSKRIELAIKLGCSILQYNCTPWFARGWCKEHIYFFSDQSKQSLIDVDHPLISQSFPCTVSASAGTAPEPQETLLDFAILLMELYYRTTFEDWVKARYPQVSQEMEDPERKRVYAMKWQKEMPRYADFWDVVGICLWPHQLKQYGEESWEDTEWRFAFYKFVISPLLEQ